MFDLFYMAWLILNPDCTTTALSVISAPQSGACNRPQIICTPIFDIWADVGAKSKIHLSKDPALWRRAHDSDSEGLWVHRIGYLILLSVLHQGGLSAEAGALGGTLVLPPDWATRFVSDTLNLSSVGRPGETIADEQERGHLSYHTAVRQVNKFWCLDWTI